MIASQFQDFTIDGEDWENANSDNPAEAYRTKLLFVIGETHFTSSVNLSSTDWWGVCSQTGGCSLSLPLDTANRRGRRPQTNSFMRALASRDEPVKQGGIVAQKTGKMSTQPADRCVTHSGSMRMAKSIRSEVFHSTKCYFARFVIYLYFHHYIGNVWCCLEARRFLAG